MRINKPQLRRLARIEAKLSARSVLGLLPLKSATKLSETFRALDELDRMPQRGLDLNEDEKERQQLLRTFLPKMVAKVVLPVGHQYRYADLCRDEQRFSRLYRQWRKSKDAGKRLSPGDQIELDFLTAHQLLYQYSPEGIRRREENERRSRVQWEEVLEEASPTEAAPPAEI